MAIKILHISSSIYGLIIRCQSLHSVPSIFASSGAMLHVICVTLMFKHTEKKLERIVP